MKLDQMLLETVRLPEEFLTKVAAKFLHGVVGIMFLVVVLFVVVVAEAVVAVVVAVSARLDVKVCHPRFVPAPVRGEICRTVEDFFAFGTPVLDVNDHAAPAKNRPVSKVRS